MPEAKSPRDERQQDDEREEEQDIALRVVQAEESAVRAARQVGGRTGQRREVRTELDSCRRLGTRARAVVGAQRGRAESAEIDDERQQQELASPRQRPAGRSQSVRAKDQPAGNDDQTENEERIE